MKQLLVATLSLSLLLACSPKKAYTSVEVNEFNEIVQDSTIQVLDVRTRDEFNEAHIEDALFVDLADSLFEAKTQELLVKSKKVAVYCRTGRRSKEAAQQLSRRGYEVVELNKGITEWVNEGLPVLK